MVFDDGPCFDSAGQRNASLCLALWGTSEPSIGLGVKVPALARRFVALTPALLQRERQL